MSHCPTIIEINFKFIVHQPTHIITPCFLGDIPPSTRTLTKSLLHPLQLQRVPWKLGASVWFQPHLRPNKGCTALRRPSPELSRLLLGSDWSRLGFGPEIIRIPMKFPWNPPLKPSFYWAARWVADSTMEITKNAEHVVQMDVPSGKHTKNYGTSPLLMGWLTISMVIFNSYVKLPDSNNRCVSLPQKGPMLQDVLNYWIHCKVL